MRFYCDVFIIFLYKILDAGCLTQCIFLLLDRSKISRFSASVNEHILIIGFTLSKIIIMSIINRILCTHFLKKGHNAIFQLKLNAKIPFLINYQKQKFKTRGLRFGSNNSKYINIMLKNLNFVRNIHMCSLCYKYCIDCFWGSPISQLKFKKRVFKTDIWLPWLSKYSLIITIANIDILQIVNFIYLPDKINISLAKYCVKKIKIYHPDVIYFSEHKLVLIILFWFDGSNFPEVRKFGHGYRIMRINIL